MSRICYGADVQLAELMRQGGLPENTRCRLRHWTFGMARNLCSPREVVELLLLIGYFRMICGVMTTLEVEVESPFGARVLASLRSR